VLYKADQVEHGIGVYGVSILLARLRGISKGHNMTVLGLGGIGKAIVLMDPIPWLLHIKTVCRQKCHVTE
jgi:hypothetical protein